MCPEDADTISRLTELITLASSPFALLSEDLLVHVLEHLVEPRDIASASAVSQRLSAAMAASSGWQVRLQRAFGASVVEAACDSPRVRYRWLYLMCIRGESNETSGREWTFAQDADGYEALRSLVWLATHQGGRGGETLAVPTSPAVCFEHARRVSGVMLDPNWLAKYSCPLLCRAPSTILFCLAVACFDWCIDSMAQECCMLFSSTLLRAMDHHASHRVLAPHHELEKIGAPAVLHLSVRLARRVPEMWEIGINMGLMPQSRRYREEPPLAPAILSELRAVAADAGATAQAQHGREQGLLAFCGAPFLAAVVRVMERLAVDAPSTTVVRPNTDDGIPVE